MLPWYRADWEPTAASGRRALRVSWGFSAGLWGPSTLSSTQVSWETLILKNWTVFPVCMWICNRLAPCDPSALLADKTASFRKKTCRLALPLIMRQKIVDLSKTLIFFTYLWVRKWCFESLRSMNFPSNPSCIWPHWCDWN